MTVWLLLFSTDRAHGHEPYAACEDCTEEEDAPAQTAVRSCESDTNGWDEEADQEEWNDSLLPEGEGVGKEEKSVNDEDDGCGG